jgi:hypothetical protein
MATLLQIGSFLPPDETAELPCEKHARFDKAPGAPNKKTASGHALDKTPPNIAAGRSHQPSPGGYTGDSIPKTSRYLKDTIPGLCAKNKLKRLTQFTV